jgi:hypothetical protein
MRPRRQPKNGRAEVPGCCNCKRCILILYCSSGSYGALSANQKFALRTSGGEFPNREFPRSGIDGNSSGIPFSKMAFSGNSSEFPYREGVLALQGGFLFTGRYCFIYREVPPHCATKHPYLRLQNQKRTGAKSGHSGPV